MTNANTILHQELSLIPRKKAFDALPRKHGTDVATGTFALGLIALPAFHSFGRTQKHA